LVYYVEPTSGSTTKGGIMVLQDVYSIRVFAPDSSKSTDRTVAICDALADAGYAVVLLDLFGAEALDLAVAAPDEDKGQDYTNFDVFAAQGGPEWFEKQIQYADKHRHKLVAAADFLASKTRTNEKQQPLGCLGFCFGNWLMSKAQSVGDISFTCGVGCHPSTVLENMAGGSELEMLRSIQVPWLFLAAKNDAETFKNKDGAGRAALEATGGGVIDFDDMVHGWVSRGDASKKHVARDVEKAMSDILDFFEKKMK